MIQTFYIKLNNVVFISGIGVPTIYPPTLPYPQPFYQYYSVPMVNVSCKCPYSHLYICNIFYSISEHVPKRTGNLASKLPR